MKAITRRGALSSAAAVGVSSAASAADKPIPKRKSKRATFVLVHGGGHGGWCWQRVAEPLRAMGHDVYCPSLTGMADRSHLLNPGIDLDTQITDVVNLLKWEDLKNVILVGHSYGGMVITGTADRAREHVGHMVYYDAAHPKNGTALWARPNAPAGNATDSSGGNSGNAAGARLPAADDPRIPKVVNGVELILFPTEPFIKQALLQGWDHPEDIAWLMAKLTPHPAKCFYQPVKLDNEEAVHKLPTTDIWRKSILGAQQKAGSGFSWAQRLWAIDNPAHNLMITNPKETVEMLVKIADMT